MWMYLSTFTISTIFFYFGDRSFSKLYRMFYSFLGVLVASLLAGMRSQTVGTDLTVYGIRFYEYAVSSRSFSDLLNILAQTGEKNDLGLHLINFILSRISSNYHLGLFVYSFISITCIYIGMRKLNEIYGISTALGMLCYFFLLFNFSLNGIKQSIAISIIFLAIMYLIEDRYIVYFILSIIAYFMHGSAILSIPIIIVYLILRDGRTIESKKKKLQFSLIIILFVIIIIYLKNITSLLTSIGLVRSNYLNYLSGGIYSQSNGIDIFTTGLSFAYLFADLVLYKKLNLIVKNNSFLFSLTVLCFLTSIGSMISTYLSRSSYYFILIATMYQFILLKHFDNNSKHFFEIILIILLLIGWIYNIVLMNFNNTLPYVFSLN